MLGITATRQAMQPRDQRHVCLWPQASTLADERVGKNATLQERGVYSQTKESNEWTRHETQAGEGLTAGASEATIFWVLNGWNGGNCVSFIPTGQNRLLLKVNIQLRIDPGQVWVPTVQVHTSYCFHCFLWDTNCLQQARENHFLTKTKKRIAKII